MEVPRIVTAWKEKCVFDQKAKQLIRLTDLIRLTGVTLGESKIHCATGDKPTPLEVFYDGKFEQWQADQSNRNFECEHIISLIHLGNADWLFAGIHKVLGVKPMRRGGKERFQYSTSEVPDLEHLTGRVVIHFVKNFRASYLRGERYADSLLVKEIKAERQTIGDFPGFNRVCLSYQRLQTIIRQDLKDWKTVLGNVAGVYLIADTKTGKQYVGSAYGEAGIWQRWREYAETGHGGNKELRQLVKQADDYAQNFLFSILEVVDINASNEFIIGRESHWKDVLLTRKYGYNY